MNRTPIALPKGTLDETGHRYGRLMVVEYVGREETSGSARWLCICDCDREVIVRGQRLRAGRQVSCGCERADPNVRQAARMKVSARRRKQIARMGGNARATNRPSSA